MIGEELGLIGATTVLICFCVIAWRGLRIASRAQDAFGAFLALGAAIAHAWGDAMLGWYMGSVLGIA